MDISHESAVEDHVTSFYTVKSHDFYDVLLKRDILRQMLQEASVAFDPHVDVADLGSNLYVVHADVWHNFIGVLRYIGGTDSAVPEGFIAAPPHPGGVFDDSLDANPSATLRNFMGNAIDRVTMLAGDPISGFGKIREFVTEKYKAYAMALRHIAENDLQDNSDHGAGGVLVGSAFHGNTHLDDYVARLVSNFFRNDMEAIQLEYLGIKPESTDGYTRTDLVREMGSIYTPTSEDDMTLIDAE
jgi:hypothetical protein